MHTPADLTRDRNLQEADHLSGLSARTDMNMVEEKGRHDNCELYAPHVHGGDPHPVNSGPACVHGCACC